MTQTPQPPRDWQKDMEMCEAATHGPWKIFAKELETLIGTDYDHPQLQAPDSIVGHAYGIKGEYVYIRENDAKLLAEARTALPYWLQEAKVYKQSYEGTLTAWEAEKARAAVAEGEARYQKGVTEDYAKGYHLQELRAIEAEAREQRLAAAIAAVWNEWFIWDDKARAAQIMQGMAYNTLRTLYPDTPAPTPKEDLK